KSIILRKKHGNKVDDRRSNGGHQQNTRLTVVSYCMEEGWIPEDRRSAPVKCRSAKEPTASNCDQLSICVSAPTNCRSQHRSAQNLIVYQLELTGVSRTCIGRPPVNRK
ncbi:hypothetical protein HAX54_042851, partial [Datura stramonium]|nr:hypothetical protein [Datura stramonium]